MNINETIGIAQLIHQEHAGDWHDKPLRYVVVVGQWNSLMTQKFSTFRDAKIWASCVRRSNGNWKTASDLFTATWNR